MFKRMFGKITNAHQSTGKRPSWLGQLDAQKLTPDQNRMMIAANIVAATASGLKNSSAVQDVIRSLGTFKEVPEKEGFLQFIDYEAVCHVEANENRALIYIWQNEPQATREEMLELASTSMVQMCGPQVGSNTMDGPVAGSLQRFFECNPNTKEVARLVVGQCATPFTTQDGEALNGLIVDVNFGLSLKGYTMHA